MTVRPIIREMERSEIDAIWQIDRGEFVDGIYYLEDGELVLKPEQYDMKGWPPGEAEHYGPMLLDCFDRGGTFYGAFERDRLVGVAVLEDRFIGSRLDQLQLKFLHVSRPYRSKGLGTRLFREAEARARELGARRLYISSTPSRHTVEYYMSLGCRPAAEVDSGLFELEPEDIHLEYVIPSDVSADEGAS